MIILHGMQRCFHLRESVAILRIGHFYELWEKASYRNIHPSSLLVWEGNVGSTHHERPDYPHQKNDNFHSFVLP